MMAWREKKNNHLWHIAMAAIAQRVRSKLRGQAVDAAGYIHFATAIELHAVDDGRPREPAQAPALPELAPRHEGDGPADRQLRRRSPVSLWQGPARSLRGAAGRAGAGGDRRSTRLNSSH